MAAGRLEAFEQMLADIQKQAEYESEQLKKLKADGKEKSRDIPPVFRQPYAL